MMSRCFDLQVNGYAGVDFSREGLMSAAVEEVAERLAGEGTERFLPTVITSSLEVYRQVLPVLGRACERNPQLPGIHLEGPFISPEEGAVGAHPERHVRAPSIDLFNQLQEWASGHIRLMTLAPEQPGALGLIEYLSANRTVVSIGHTLAASGTIRDACNAGATLATHVGNGIPNHLNRTDNPIWSILASPLSVMLIADGFHCPPDFLKAVYAIKGSGKIILTSDVSPVAGLPPGDYELFGTRVRLTDEGCVRNLNAPTLAGSGATLPQCREICRNVLGLGEDDLEKMCRTNAEKVLAE